MSGSCPLCGQPLGSPHLVEVCGECHHDLVVRGTVSPGTTTEFYAADVPHGPERAPEDRTPRPADAACSWCGRQSGQVKKLLSRGEAHICNECVALCADIMTAELGERWRE